MVYWKSLQTNENEKNIGSVEIPTQDLECMNDTLNQLHDLQVLASY